MANEVKKVNTIAIADIKNINTLTDDNIKNLNTLEFTGIVYPSWAGSRAVIYGGVSINESEQTTPSTAYILYKTIASDGNAAEFDEAQNGREGGKGSGSNGTRAVWGGGWSRTEANGSSTLGVEQMDYVTVASTNSALDFGNLNNPTGYGGSDGASNGTLAFFNGGRSSGGYQNDMEYVTISSTGSVGTGGDLEANQAYHSTSNGDSKYLIMGGRLSSPSTKLDTVSQNSFSTSASATDFGAVGQFAMYYSAVACSTTRVVVAGGGGIDDIHYFSPASAVDSVDDGYSILAPLYWISGTSDGTTGEFFGGEGDSSVNHHVNYIQKITIASLANATDAGDLAHPDFDWDEHTYSQAGGASRMNSQSGT